PRTSLLFTDIDSLCYSIETEDFYKDIEGDIDKYFDTSDYPKEHPLKSDKNKKVIGKFKDECNGRQIVEFIGLRPKMYSILVDDGTGKLTGSKKAKGIKKSVIKKYITHDDYKKVLRGLAPPCDLQGSQFVPSRQMVRMKMLRSASHEIRSIEVQKVGLSCYDNKRYLLDNV